MNQVQPWWAGQLEELRKRSLRYLRSRFPRISDHHEDIESEARTQLAELLAANASTYPRSWYLPDPPPKEEQDYFFKLSQTILRRRAADHFRDRVRTWAREVEAEGAEDALQHAPENERVATMRQALRICIGFIADLSNEDQVLVSILAGEADRPAPFTEVERQRIHRIRKRLAAEIEARLGERVSSILEQE